ncbi:hypothetical protein TNCT_228061 [Trichonephila clavata]|uniref:Uncharacterized protein n=1 Tax=Trichonephila clavata TaxID=2740835 RepID=A0A8X6HV90_TRICU|nr:hypothetical protein TNCT_228061 [Trichonephila clavata]
MAPRGAIMVLLKGLALIVINATAENCFSSFLSLMKFETGVRGFRLLIKAKNESQDFSSEYVVNERKLQRRPIDANTAIQFRPHRIMHTCSTIEPNASTGYYVALGGNENPAIPSN